MEILDGGLGDAAVEIEHVGLRICRAHDPLLDVLGAELGTFVPYGGLVVHDDEVLCSPPLPPLHNPVSLLFRSTSFQSHLARRGRGRGMC